MRRMDDASRACTVRPVESSDVDAVTAIYAHSVEHGTGTFELVAPGAAEMADRIDSVTRAGLPYLVAVAGGEVVGFGYAGIYRPRPAYRFTVEDSVYVGAESAGRGVGTRLLEELVRRCEALELRQMIAVIGDSTNVASIRLHERCGFVTVGTLQHVGWKHDRWLDTVLMQRTLGAGSATPAPS